MKEVIESLGKIRTKLMEGFGYNESFFDTIHKDLNRAYDIAHERGKVEGLTIAIDLLFALNNRQETKEKQKCQQ